MWPVVGPMVQPCCPGYSSLHNFVTVCANRMVNATACDVPELPSLSPLPKGAGLTDTGLSITPREQSLVKGWTFSFLPLCYCGSDFKYRKRFLISRQRLLKRVNYVTFIICCADLFKQVSWIFFFLLYQLFLNQGLQHPCACCRDDAELTTARFNIQLPGLGVLPWRRGRQAGTCCGKGLWEGWRYQSAEVWQLAQSKAFHTRNVTRYFFR